MKKYCIITFGCQMNFSDSERIEGFLDDGSLQKSRDPLKSDLLIINSCGVRQSAENRAVSRIKKFKKINPNLKIILTGCLAKRKDIIQKTKEEISLFIEIKKFFNLNLNQLKIKQKLKKTNKSECDYLKITPKYEKENSISIPIMTGCNNFCSYCVVPYARGKEISRNPKEIINEIKKSKNKIKQVLLLGQNVNSYVFKGTDFTNLLDKLAIKFPKIVFSFLTSHPKDFKTSLIKIIKKHKNIKKEIHLPLQSGSDRILKKMNRPYTQKKYLKIIETIKKEIPEAIFTTDVIIGFPGETDKDFTKTIKVFKKVKFKNAYLNKYSPRSGTKAFELKDPICWKIKKEREKKLRKILNNNN